MSKIDTQIKELQHKKLKIDYLEYIKDLIINDKMCIDYAEVTKEIQELVTPKLDEMIQSIEDGVVLRTALNNQLTDTEIKVVKPLVERVQNKTSRSLNETNIIKDEIPPKNPQKPPQNNPQAEEADLNAKMQFAMSNRHLANRDVKTPDGVTGKIVGLDSPYVIVDYGNGTKDKFRLEQVEIL